MTRVNKSGIFTPLNENANDLVRGYFMRDSEGGYAPNNYQVNTRGGGNNLMNNYLKMQNQKEKKSTKKKTTKKK
jgi:hypothetical protein